MAEDNILASNLAQLGGQISSTFQNVALQNQYKNALPGIQQAFQSAMADFDSGRSGAGFSKIMAVAMENPNNPMIQNISQMAFKAGQFASDDYFKSQTLSVSRAKAAESGVELTPEEIEEFENFGTKRRSGGTPANTTTATTGLPATRIGSDGIVTVADVNAPELPTRTGNEPPQVSLTEPVDFVTPVAETEGVTELKPNQQRVDTSHLVELGIPIAEVIGPKEFDVEEPQGTTESMKITSKGLLRDKSTSTKPVKKNTAEQNDFLEKVEKSKKAASAIKSNAQLKKIFESSGRNFDNILIDQDALPDGKIIYSAVVTDSKGVKTKEPLSESEYNHLDVLKGIPDYVQTNKDKITVISPKAEKELSAADKVRKQFGKTTIDSTKTPAPTTSGMPAAQFPSAPDNPFDKVIEESLARQSTTQKSSNEKSLRTKIADYDQKISSLSGGTTKKASLRPEFLQKQKAEYNRLWAERETLKSELEKLTSSK